MHDADSVIERKEVRKMRSGAESENFFDTPQRSDFRKIVIRASDFQAHLWYTHADLEFEIASVDMMSLYLHRKKGIKATENIRISSESLRFANFSPSLRGIIE